MRSRVIEQLQLLSLPSMQREYEASLATNGRAGHVPTELISGFCDDLFNPKNPEFVGAFSNEEIKQLAHLYGLIVDAFEAVPSSVREMHLSPSWRRVMSLAKDLYAQFQHEA